MSNTSKTQKLENQTQELLDKSLIKSRPLVITTTDQHDAIDAYAIYAIEDATFTTLDNQSTGDSLVGSTLYAGGIWYIPIRGSIKLAGGSVIVYQNNILGK